MSVKSGETVVIDFETENPTTGALVNADSLPTGTLVIDGTDNGATVTVTNKATGRYKASVTIPAAQTTGKKVSLYIAATIASTACGGTIWQDTIDSKYVGDLNDAAAAPTAAAVRAEIDANSTQLSGIKTKTDTIPAAGPPSAADYTSGRAAKLDFLDAAISSLATAAALGSLQTDATTLLTRLSSARAGYLDNLSGGAVALASALTAAAGDVTTLVGRLTALRAGYLDNLTNLDAAVSSRLAEGSYSAPPSAAAIRAEIDAASVALSAIFAKVTNLPADPADASDIATATTAILADTASLLSRLSDARALLLDRIADLTELDGSVYRFTTNALEQGPSGSGLGLSTALSASPTAGTVGDALWAAVNMAKGKKTVVKVGDQWKLRVYVHNDPTTIWRTFDVDHPVAPSSAVPA